MVVKVDKIGRILVSFCIIFSIIENALIFELHFPTNISYLTDIAVFVIMVLMTTQGKKNMLFEKNYLLFLVIIYTASLFFGIIYNGINFKLLLWATRNTYRFYIFYFACIRYFHFSDIEKIINVMFILNIVSTFIGLYQFLILGYIQDNVGGIFGHGNGAALNTFSALLVAIYFCAYMKKKVKISKFLIVLISTSLIAAIAEEKAFFVYIAAIVFTYLLVNKATPKMILIGIVIAIIMIFAIKYLYETNEWMSRRGMYSIDAYIVYAKESYGINRLNPFSDINKKFFKGNIFLNLFGYGFGNCELSTGVKALTSDFAQKYYNLQFYDFTSQMRFLETGYVGFITYISFFIYIALFAMKYRKSLNKTLSLYSNITICYVVVVVISIWMSSALRAKEAYIIYFGLAILPIIKQDINYFNKKKDEI
nr:hypothetical protein [uncultured Anaerobutyricum sp.]